MSTRYALATMQEVTAAPGAEEDSLRAAKRPRTETSSPNMTPTATDAEMAELEEEISVF